MSAFGQSLSLNPDTSTNTDQVTTSFDIVEMPAYLTNISGMDTNVMWEVVSITAPSAWETQFCDKYTCIDISVLPNSMYDLAARDSSTMKGQVIPSCVPGTGVLRVKMWIQGDPSTEIIGTYVSQVTVDTSTCKATGMEVIFGDEGLFLVHPNPTTNSVFIDLESTSSELQLSIYDLNGALVRSEMISNKAQYDVSELSQGLYTVTVADEANSKLYTKRLMKQ